MVIDQENRDPGQRRNLTHGAAGECIGRANRRQEVLRPRSSRRSVRRCPKCAPVVTEPDLTNRCGTSRIRVAIRHRRWRPRGLSVITPFATGTNAPSAVGAALPQSGAGRVHDSRAADDKAVLEGMPWAHTRTVPASRHTPGNFERCSRACPPLENQVSPQHRPKCTEGGQT
jgi:hypothetical protein